jgi:hypothetical protein
LALNAKFNNSERARLSDLLWAGCGADSSPCKVPSHFGGTVARILLVEDDPDVRPLLEHILLEDGYEVITAESVATATTILGTQPFDLVICDVNLPDGSGLRIADKAVGAGIKALVVTGQGLTLNPVSLRHTTICSSRFVATNC